MKVLLLAPQPFYEERGTPIAVDLLLKALSERGDSIDVLTYHLGIDVDYKNVRIHRIPRIPFIKKVSPGFSWQKVICDIFLFLQVMVLVSRNQYQIVHAVEESVFMAVFLKAVNKIPYVYDMDSSLSQQMVDKYPYLFKPFAFLIHRMEGYAIRHAKAVVPVCDALSKDIDKYHPEKVLILRDVSLLMENSKDQPEDLRAELGISGPMMMYVGNLESYQGIDLMLKSFALAISNQNQAHLVIIGGKKEDTERYRKEIRQLGLEANVHILGPRPIERLASYLKQADILVSPRVKGTNTPMKIYSYLDSGRALIATDLPTHTQVLDSNVAVLAQPAPGDFSSGVLRLLEDKELRQRLGNAGKKLIQEKHTYPVFRQNLYTLYDWLAAEIERDGSSHAGVSA